MSTLVFVNALYLFWQDIIGFDLWYCFNYPKKNGNIFRIANGIYGNTIAYYGDPVHFSDGSNSSLPLHARNNGGVSFKKDDFSGYYYVINSEAGYLPSGEYDGRVYVLELGIYHNPVDWYPVLARIVDHCDGGKPPWGTGLYSKEEDGYGNFWQDKW